MRSIVQTFTLVAMALWVRMMAVGGGWGRHGRVFSPLDEEWQSKEEVSSFTVEIQA